MKKIIILGALPLFVGILSAFSTKNSATCWYGYSTAFSGPTDQADCSITFTINCTITDGAGSVHTPIFDDQVNIGDEAHVCKFQ